MPPRATTPRRVVRRPSAHVAPSPAVPAPDTVTIGLDASLTGYGVIALWPSGYSETLIRTDAKQNYAQRLTFIREALSGVFSTYQDRIGLICMERPAYAASGAFTGGLVHAATAFALVDVFGLDDKHIAPVLVAGNTLKKFVTGKGVAQKGLMVKYVFQKWGYDTNDDNLADAYGLARLAAAILSGPCEHKYEQECVEVVRKGMTWLPSDVRGVERPSPLVNTPSATKNAGGSTPTAVPASTRRRASGGVTTPVTHPPGGSGTRRRRGNIDAARN